MIALYIIGGIIVFFAVILSLNVTLRVIVDSENRDNTNIYAKIGFYKIYIIPAKEKKPKKIKQEKVRKVRKKKEKPVKAKKKPAAEEVKKEKQKLNIPAIINLAKDIALMFWKKIRKFLKIKIYKINMSVSAEDAHKTAMLYGYIIQSAYYLYEVLDNNFKVSRKTYDNIKITPNFFKEKLSFNIDVKISIKISHVFNIGFSAAVKFVKFLIKSKTAQTEIKN
ncbi:MAG: DUF2953 domain-containing protein [Oscillospiraceae bacterium]|nr:DUF2953 domain-containing protein [Oscillospiraceae bacterium]